MVATPKTAPKLDVPPPDETRHERAIQRKDRARLVVIAVAIVALMVAMAWLARWAGVPIPMEFPLP